MDGWMDGWMEQQTMGHNNDVNTPLLLSPVSERACDPPSPIGERGDALPYNYYSTVPEALA